MKAFFFIFLLFCSSCGENILTGDTIEDDFVIDDFIIEDFITDEAELDEIDGAPPVTWARTYDDGSIDELFTIQQTLDGGYIVSGDTQLDIRGNIYLWLLKLDNVGNPAWQKVYGSGEIFYRNLIQHIFDGMYILGGTTQLSSFEDTNILLIKLDREGDIVLQKIYGGEGNDAIKSLQQTSDGGYIVAGASNSFSPGDHDFWVVKLEENGGIIWQKAYGSEYDDWANAIQQTLDGGYVICGRGFGESLWIIKLNDEGNIEWQEKFDGRSDAEAYSIVQTIDNGYALVGKTDIWMDIFDRDNIKIVFIKFDSDGLVAWQKIYDGPREDVAHAVQQTSDGGYIIAGYTDSFGAGAYDFLIIKLDESGNIQWQKTYGDTSYDVAYSIQETSEGGYIAAGNIDNSGMLNTSYWILKLDEDGNISEDCPPGIGLDSSLTVEELSAAPMNTDVIPIESNAIVTDSEVHPIVNDCIVTTQCSG